jgi:hypothetical protein
VEAGAEAPTLETAAARPIAKTVIIMFLPGKFPPKEYASKQAAQKQWIRMRIIR